MRGTFRFDREFQLAVDYLGKGLLHVKQVITATLPVDRAVEAFDLASDKHVSTTRCSSTSRSRPSHSTI